jgi:NAD(P)-dependent dehydrogenase (short-subunit alcohol dehydrogenase family)
MKVLQVNLASVFATTRALLELLKAAGSPSSPARIINIGSVDGIRVSPIEHYA